MPPIPSFRLMLWPALQAVRALGGSGRVEEVNEKAIELQRFTEDQEAQLHGAGPRTEVEYRLAWARTHLKWMGALDNSSRGVWALTDLGRTITPDEVDRLFRQQRSERVKRRRERRQAQDQEELAVESLDEEPDERDWKEELLGELLDLTPGAFERLSKRLLREAGFISVVVTGQTGDGGIDGLGVYRLSLVSFPVFFQCKRYRGSVRAGAVRDFRGAMAGRGDKGLLITTGSFTADAKREATREGAPPIDLIDGDRLCDLLKEFRLGVHVTERVVEDVVVDPSVFADV